MTRSLRSSSSLTLPWFRLTASVSPLQVPNFSFSSMFEVSKSLMPSGTLQIDTETNSPVISFSSFVALPPRLEAR